MDLKHEANNGIPVQCPEDRALGTLEVKCQVFTLEDSLLTLKVGPDKTQ